MAHNWLIGFEEVIGTGFVSAWKSDLILIAPSVGDCIIIGSKRSVNDTVIYPDKVRINLYYLDHYSFVKDFQMILCTVLGKKMEYNGEVI